MDSKNELKNNTPIQSKNDSNEKTSPSCITILGYWLIIIVLIFFLAIGMSTFVMLKNPIKLIKY